MRQHRLRVFTDERGDGGNPTLVLEGADSTSDAELIEAAARFGGECTTIFEGESRVPRLRFFFPTGEMAFCGHGTLGAATVLRRRHAESFAIRIGDGSVQVRVRRSGAAPAVAELTTPLGPCHASPTGLRHRRWTRWGSPGPRSRSYPSPMQEGAPSP